MLKRIENAQLHCIWSDAKIKYADGHWSDVKLLFEGDRQIVRVNPKVRKLTRRKIFAQSIAVKFTVTFSIGGYGTIVPRENADDFHTYPLKNSGIPIDEMLDTKANEFLKEKIIYKSMDEPHRFEYDTVVTGASYWLFQGKFYKDTEDLKKDEVKALLLTRHRLRKARINRAKTIASTPETPVEGLRRGFIAEDVRLLVWERDGGKCTKCGSRSELQYDHIIPFSLGGSSSADNLQILCGSCNRAKSNSIA